MRSGFVGLILLATGACTPGAHRDAPAPTEIVAPVNGGTPQTTASSAPSEPPTLTSDPVMLHSRASAMATVSLASYASAWVDGTRASRSEASRRPLNPLESVVDLGAQTGRLGRLEHLLLAPDGEHLVVRGADGAGIFDRAGRHLGTIAGTTVAGLTVVTRTGVLHGLDGFDWSGAATSIGLYIPGAGAGRVWAMHLVGNDVFFVNQEAMMGNHESRQPERLEVVGNHLVAGSLFQKLIGADCLKSTKGLGAIARDGRLVVLTLAGELHVYAPRADADFDLIKVSAGRLHVTPYDVSIVGDSLAVLEAHGSPVDPEDGLGPYQSMADVFLRFSQMSGHWTTTLHVLSFSGAERWQVTVPFEVLEPPVDGGGGRVYLAGTGFAAVENGHVKWSQARGARNLATAFAGGEVAITVGNALRLVDRGGTVLQSFTSPDGPFVTPPAIAEDGSVWVATAKAIHAAR